MEKEVHNKIDTIMKKERACTSITKRKGRQVKGTPRMMQTSVDDSAVTLCTTVAREEVVKKKAEADSSSCSRCESRQSNKSVDGNTDGKEDDNEIPISAEKSKEGETLNEGSSCVRLLIKGNLGRNHSWESDGRDSN